MRQGDIRNWLEESSSDETSGPFVLIGGAKIPIVDGIEIPAWVIFDDSGLRTMPSWVIERHSSPL